jgi:hypothetical protein
MKSLRDQYKDCQKINKKNSLFYLSLILLSYLLSNVRYLTQRQLFYLFYIKEVSHA